MQHRLSLKFLDQEGFATSRIEVKDQPKETYLPIRDKLCSPKQLINTIRPDDFEPRVLDNGIEMTLLPSYMNVVEQEIEENPNGGIHLTKIQFNGKGKSLYDYFINRDFACIYSKYKDQRSVNEMYYDFTSRIKIVQHTNDYNWKLYKKLSQPDIQPLQSTQNIQFDSNFESGNARYIYKKFAKPDQYFVLLENDTNTHGYNQWFFFRAKNKVTEQITIHIMNMIKRKSLYKQGMKIAIFSIKQYEINKRGWHRGGTKIGYINTGIERTTKQNQNHYCLSFNYTFQHQNDCVYFALTVPYTYSRIALLLDTVAQNCSQHSIPYRQKTLGYSLLNNRISVMRIGFQQGVKKKCIVILSRQHPCETMGSFVCQGFVKQLTSNRQQSVKLFQEFSFVIVPMVNPDGVIEGNSRCNVSGIDLNRQWTDPIKELTPETYYIKRYLERLHQQNGIQAIIDLHGHSKKTNSFFYCCEKKDKSEMRLLSIVMGKLCEQFDYTSCTYSLTKDKVSTIRGKFNSLGINCYTLENSYFGWYNKSYHGFTGESFNKIGQALVKSLFLIYCSPSNEQLTDLGYDFDKNSVLEEIKKSLFRIEAEEKYQKEDSGSDSDPDGDLFDVQERLHVLKMKQLLNTNSHKSILRGLKNVSKSSKYESPLVLQNQKEYKKRNEQTVELKRRKKGKHSLNLQPQDFRILQNTSPIVKKNTQPSSVKDKKIKGTGRLQVNRNMRLASSLNKPSRLQYFVSHQQRSSANMTKVQSNHNLQQPTFVKKRPVSCYRTQTKFFSTGIKNKTRLSTKFPTEGDESYSKKISKIQALSTNQNRSKSPNQKELKIIEVTYLQKRKQRLNLVQEGQVFKSKEMRRRNLISDTKFKRFESFLQNHPEKTSQNGTKQLGNRVFYRFPVL